MSKRKHYKFVVLSWDNINLILDQLDVHVNLVIKLLYSYGIRVSEGLNLRVQNFSSLV